MKNLFNEMGIGRIIIGIGAVILIILFFTPLAESKVGTYTGFQIVTDDSGYISNAGALWLILMIPIALLICTIARARSIVLGMVSLAGLVGMCIWVFGYGDGWEFLPPTYIMLTIYIGLTIIAFAWKNKID